MAPKAANGNGWQTASRRRGSGRTDRATPSLSPPMGRSLGSAGRAPMAKAPDGATRLQTKNAPASAAVTSLIHASTAYSPSPVRRPSTVPAFPGPAQASAAATSLIPVTAPSGARARRYAECRQHSATSSCCPPHCRHCTDCQPCHCGPHHPFNRFSSIFQMHMFSQTKHEIRKSNTTPDQRVLKRLTPILQVH